MFDTVIIGLGLSGLLSAYKLSKLGKKVLIIEKRNHIGGNVYDKASYNGILEQVYGPHIFHTDNKEVVDFLSKYTDFVEYEHKVAIKLNGEYITMPFNLNSINEVFPKTLATRLETKLIDKYGYGVKIPILKLREDTDKDLNFLSNFIYENIFLGYTIKQWGGIKPEELDKAVTSRVPISISRDNRYFQNKYQLQPKYGFTQMCENILSDIKNTSIMFNTNASEILKFDVNSKKIYLDNIEFKGNVIYTGRIEEILKDDKTILPYRSLRFDKEIHTEIDEYQPYSVVNYSNTQNYTRITEFKKLLCQNNIRGTVIIKEHSVDYNSEANDYSSIPYYPVPQEKNILLYNSMKEKVNTIFPNVRLLGRLAEYKYYDMDSTIANALNLKL